MNQIELEHAADERLFDAALTEVLASTPARPAASAPRWFAAAILLLGTGVLLAIALLAPRPDAAATQPPQQPELPPPIRVEGKAALAAVDRTAQNLWCVLQPGDLPLLAEFTQLRRLLLEEQSDPIGLWLGNGKPWSLAPLAACTHLQSLGIGDLHRFAPQELIDVAQLPELREIELIGTGHLVDAAFVDLLQKLPLHSLSLQAVAVHPQGFAALSRLPLLEHLELRDCLHLDRCDLTQLQQLRQLHSLSLRGVGGGLADSLSKSHPLADEPKLEPPPDPPGVLDTGLQMPGGERLLLTAEVMRAIAALPRLRELNLATSPLDDDALAALPAQLTALDVSACTWFGTKGLMAAPPLPHLTALGCSMPTVVRQDATLWQFLAAHPLRRLRFQGPLTAETCEQLAQQTELRELDIVGVGVGDTRIDLGFTAAMSVLERLALVNVPDFDPTPLLKLQHLRRVELRRSTADTVTRTRRALGDRVQVIVTDD